MKLSSAAAEVRFQVPFHDVDAARIVWHGNYFRYFEYGRSELMRMHDLDVQQVVDLGYGMVVSESRCRHTSPARYGDFLTVRASFVDADFRIGVGYVVENETAGGISARGRTDLVVVDEQLALLRSIPSEILARIQTP